MVDGEDELSGGGSDPGSGQGMTALPPAAVVPRTEEAEPMPLAWVSDRGIEVRFPGDPDAGHSTLVSAGADGKSNPQVFTFPAGFCIAWHEGEPGSGVVKLRGLLHDGRPFGSEISIGAAGFDNHSLAVGGFEHVAATPGAEARGIGVAWVATSGVADFGRIFLQRFTIEHDERGEPVALVALAVGGDAPGPEDGSDAARLDGANDNLVEVAAEGSEPAVNTLASGDTLVTWVGSDLRMHGSLVPAAGGGDGIEPAEGSLPGQPALETALSDLGPAGSPEQGPRRLQALELGTGQLALMWIVLAESGAELRGTILPAPAAAAEGDLAAGLPAAVAVGPIRLPPGFDGRFQLIGHGGDGTGFDVVYGGSAGAGAAVYAVRPDLPPGEAVREAALEAGPGDGLAVADAVLDTTPAAEAAHWAVEGAGAGAGADGATGAGTSLAALQAAAAPASLGQTDVFTIAGSTGDDGVRETAPVVEATADGFVAAWQVASEDSLTSSINLSFFGPMPEDSAGSSTGVIEVTGQADATVAPAVAGLSDSAAVAWVESTGDGSQLIVASFDPGGAASQAVVVDAGARGSYSDLVLVGQSIAGGPGGLSNQQIALAWVEGADQYGYGSINLQRYALPKPLAGALEEPVALGSDGTTDGSNAPEQLVGEAGQPVLGRDPKAAGLADGELAVIWVERDSSGPGSGAIEGVILGYGNGERLHLDLKPLMPRGLDEDSEPVLVVTPDGDIHLAWVEGSGSSGYDLRLATYTASEGGWVAPTTSVQLHHFDTRPSDFSLELAGNETGGLVLTWRSGADSNLYGQNFDFDGMPAGSEYAITSSGQSDSDTSSTAGLSDGRLVVVYTEQDGTDIDVEASLIDFDGDGSSADPGSGSGSSSATGELAALASSVTAETGPTEPSPAGAGAAADVPGFLGLATSEGEPVVVDPFDGAGGGLRITAVNGIPLGSAEPVDVGSGFVQLRDDGLLLFSPDDGFAGEAAFTCTVADAGGEWTSSTAITIAVTAEEATQAAPLFDPDYEFDYGALTQDGAGAGDGDSSAALLGTAAADGAGADSYGEAGSYDGDMLVFQPGFGSDVISNFADEPTVLDISSFGYATFEALRAAGALSQVGEDVVIVLAPSDPAVSDKITLKSFSLSALVEDDFKFS